MHFELTNQALSTILLDAIQFYPSYKDAKEAYGLLLGTEGESGGIAEYTFPVGNVKNREQSAVTENREISGLIQNARQIVGTSKTVASYHSHPYPDIYENWAKPSNADCFCVINQDIKVELIIAIAKVYTTDLPYTLKYNNAKAIEFSPQSASKHPDESDLKRKVQFIQGAFGAYEFEIKAYYNTGKSLIDIDLFSSEVSLNETLRENKLPMERLPAEAMYSIRKIEYAQRKRAARNADDKIQYHVDKIKRMELVPQLPEDTRVIDEKTYHEHKSISYLDAIRWARSGQLYADLYEGKVVLCKVAFDEILSVLFLEDLEREIGSTIDVAEYMVEAGYIETKTLNNVQRYPLRFWLLEGSL